MKIAQDVFYNYKISLNTLEALRVYSPIYDTTFDLMTWEQQKHQLDVWWEEGNKMFEEYSEIIKPRGRKNEKRNKRNN